MFGNVETSERGRRLFKLGVERQIRVDQVKREEKKRIKSLHRLCMKKDLESLLVYRNTSVSM